MRSPEAGVYYGILNEYENGTAEIINARNFWRWEEHSQSMSALSQAIRPKRRARIFKSGIKRVSARQIHRLE